MRNDIHDQPTCPFCNLDKSRVILANNHAMAISDGFSIAPGHTLIIPKRHNQSFFEATREEQTAMLDLLAETRERLLNPPGPPLPMGGETLHQMASTLASTTEQPQARR